MSWWQHGALFGAIATFVMDVWAAAAKYLFRLPTADWAMVGRWFGHMANAKFAHCPIGAAAPVRGELAIGWAAHYVIGILYGIAYVYVAGAAPRLIPALLFAWLTLAFPWLVMQPALGAGVFASHTPRPNLYRLVNFSMHTAFGIGLYAGARALAAA